LIANDDVNQQQKEKRRNEKKIDVQGYIHHIVPHLAISSFSLIDKEK